MTAHSRPTTAERVRAHTGPAILGYGFRPFFLLSGVWAALAMALWIPMLAGSLVLPTAFGPIDWHVHALVFGYVPAVVAGFLLTAVPNWTGRLPVTGMPLLLLALLWVAGRAAVLVSAALPPVLAAMVDLAFLAVFGLVVAREIVAGRNWRNLKVLLVLVLLLAGNALFHLEAARSGQAANGIGARLGIASTVFLLVLIGGRIVPSFTLNWLRRQGPGRLPPGFGRFDQVAASVAAAALVLWIALPDQPGTGFACLVAGGLHVWRLARWAPERTFPERLVLVLHVGYAFVPLGFLLLGIAILAPDVLTRSAALHAWTAGAIGVMTLAVMTRASLGHSGRPLHAGQAITALYALAVIGALARIGAGLGIAPRAMLDLAAGAWIAAFAGFAIVFAPMLTRARR